LLEGDGHSPTFHKIGHALQDGAPETSIDTLTFLPNRRWREIYGKKSGEPGKKGAAKRQKINGKISGTLMGGKIVNCATLS